MKINEIILEILKTQNVKKAVLANRLNLDRRVLDRRLKGDNLTTKSVAETTRALDYKVVIVPANVQMRDGWYEVE